MRNGIFASVLTVAFTAGLFSLQAISLEARQTRAGAAAATGEMNLGTVRIPRNVTADGKPLRAGTYRLRLTPDNAAPPAVGQTPQYERWVEFMQGSKVVGREVVSIVPPEEISQVAQDRPPASGGSKVELLKGNDYLRVWVNRGGTHYLIHLPTGASAPTL
jgi:hypothetical protein